MLGFQVMVQGGRLGRLLYVLGTISNGKSCEVG
jgi:hypothetical protein